MVSNEEMKKYLSEQYGFEVENFIILATTKSIEDVSYTYSGNTLTLIGLLSYFQTLLAKRGFKTEMHDKQTLNN